MLPSLKETIQRHQLHANKKLGQHFLTDANLLAKIVRMAGVEPHHHVIEIGPGPGGLTRALLESKAASVTALELDKRCVELLQELKAHYPLLKICHGDALDYTLTDLCPSPRVVVANLPYNVGTQILIHYLKQIAAIGGGMVDSITVMLQQEVVDRIVARPDNSDYGRLSVLCQWLCEVEECCSVPPEAFSPPPKVMSAVVRLVPRSKPLIDIPFHEMEKFLHAAFGQRRKMLRKNLKSWCADAESRLLACGIDPTRRAETLNLQEIAQLVTISD